MARVWGVGEGVEVGSGLGGFAAEEVGFGDSFNDDEVEVYFGDSWVHSVEDLFNKLS